MRRALAVVRRGGTTVGGAWQGVAGVAAVVAGVAGLAGACWALIAAGGFLLLAAWGS